MARVVIVPLFLVSVVVLLGLSACSQLGSNTSFDLTSITASSGVLTPSGSGTWTFDAGYVAQNTTDVVTFTVTNGGGGDFSATGSASFTKGDFALGINGTFTVPAGGSSSFTGSFTPSAVPTSVETGTLTLTPTDGAPITIQLKGTSGTPAFFQVVDANFTPIVSVPLTGGYGTNTITMQNPTRTDPITFTANQIVSVSDVTDFTVDTTATSLSLKAGGSTTFDLGSSAMNGATTTVTITGQDTSGVFFFTFTFQAAGG